MIRLAVYKKKQCRLRKTIKHRFENNKHRFENNKLIVEIFLTLKDLLRLLQTLRSRKKIKTKPTEGDFMNVSSRNLLTNNSLS